MVFTAIIDSIAYGKEHLLNLMYLPFCLYLFNRLMDEKPEKLARSWLPLLVVVVSITSLAVYFFTQLKTKDLLPTQERTFPLFQAQLGPIFGPAEQEPVKPWFWTRIKFDGFWTFKLWVLDPIYSWIVGPAISLVWNLCTKFTSKIRPLVEPSQLFNPEF